MTKGLEKTIGFFARKDSRKDSASTISYGGGVKDLKAKSVAAALERVSLEHSSINKFGCFLLKRSDLKR